MLAKQCISFCVLVLLFRNESVLAKSTTDLEHRLPRLHVWSLLSEYLGIRADGIDGSTIQGVKSEKMIVSSYAREWYFERNTNNRDLHPKPVMGCKMAIKDLKDNQPLYIKHNNLMMPELGHLTWLHGETTLIACTSERNRSIVFTGTNRKVFHITCVGGRSFTTDDGRQIDIASATCTGKVTANVMETSNSACPASYKLIAFNVPGIPTPVDLFHSCLNEPNFSVLYTLGYIFGQEINYKYVSSGDDPSFSAIGFPAGVAITTVYTQQSTRNALVSLFMQSESKNQADLDADRYLNQSYIQRGHLSPKGDQLFASWQWSTFLYVNVAGMWNGINQNNWKKLEQRIRDFAGRHRLLLMVYTGTYDTLKLNATSGHRPEFTLKDGKVPVPKWIWKIVVSPLTGEAISFYVSNNPFYSETPFCSVPDYGWLNGFDDDIRKGKISVCTAFALRSITHLPRISMNGLGVLKYN